MAWEMFFYDNAKSPSDFPEDPFFRLSFFGGNYRPTSQPVLHTDGFLYVGLQDSAATTGFLARFHPPITAEQTGPVVVVSSINAPSSVASFQGKVWLTAADGATATKLYSWDGISLTEAGDVALTSATCKMVPLWDKLVLAFSGTNNEITLYNPDDTFTSASMPGASFGVSTNMSLPQMVEYKGKLYILGTDSGGTKIYSIDGDGTVAVARSPTGTPYSLLEFNGFLYYLCGTSLGRYDGSAWTDAHSSFVAFAGTKLVTYKGSILVLDAAACQISDGTDTTTWSATASTTETDAHPNYAAGDGAFFIAV